MNVIEILDRPIAFHRCFVKITGSVSAALMLSQAVYWSNRTNDPDGWFYKTAEEWEEETGLSAYEQEGARRRLRATGFWEEVRKGIPARLFFRIDAKRLAASSLDKRRASLRGQRADSGKYRIQIREKPETGFGKNPNLVSGFSRNYHGTETTTEITSERGETSPPSSQIKEIKSVNPPLDEALKSELSKICGVASVNGAARKIKEAAEAITSIGGTVDLLKEFVRSDTSRAYKIEFIGSDFGGWLAARRRNGAGDQSTTVEYCPECGGAKTVMKIIGGKRSYGIKCETCDGTGRLKGGAAK
jgi:hypothetical protein